MMRIPTLVVTKSELSWNVDVNPGIPSAGCQERLGVVHSNDVSNVDLQVVAARTMRVTRRNRRRYNCAGDRTAFGLPSEAL